MFKSTFFLWFMDNCDIWLQRQSIMTDSLILCDTHSANWFLAGVMTFTKVARLLQELYFQFRLEGSPFMYCHVRYGFNQRWPVDFSEFTLKTPRSIVLSKAITNKFYMTWDWVVWPWNLTKWSLTKNSVTHHRDVSPLGCSIWACKPTEPV